MHLNFPSYNSHLIADRPADGTTGFGSTLLADVPATSQPDAQVAKARACAERLIASLNGAPLAPACVVSTRDVRQMLYCVIATHGWWELLQTITDL